MRNLPAVIGAISLTIAIPVSASESAAKLDYTIRYQPQSNPATLKVAIVATGLANTSELAAKLANWGEWTSASFPYLQNVQIDGRAISLSDSGTYAVPLSLLEDHRLKVTYDLVVQPQESAEHEERSLLPYRDDHHIFAFASNTLIGFTTNGRQLPAEVTIRVDAPKDMQVFTGWGGLSTGKQISPGPDPLRSENGVLAIGQSFGHTIENLNDTMLEIAQFAPLPNATPAVAEVARTVIESFSSAIGSRPDGPVRVLIERSQDEEVTRGTHTDAGLVVELPATLPLSDPAKELITHELFHDWLGSQLKGDDSLVWFSEGFTDYLSLWHAAANGLITPERFVLRMLGIEREARSSTSFGRVKFSDPGTNWRDGNGPNETLAYRGGALLALIVDGELRRRSGQTVNALISALFPSASPTYQLANIRDVMEQLGIADVYDRSIAGSDLPDVSPILVSLGFDEAVETASLTYLGIEAQFDGPTESGDVIPAVVNAIDPAGPAAKANVVPGDRIVGFGDRRGNPPRIDSEAPQRYRFGLNVIPSGAKSVKLDLIRDGQPVQAEIAPILVPGGRRFGLKWNPDRHTGYFDPVSVPQLLDGE